MENFKDEYVRLAALPEDAHRTEKQRRGFAFERILKDLLAKDQLEPRAGYKPAGEQIDGSFFLDGSIFLLEAKWHAAPVPASTLYQFKGKVDGKLSGTLGVFISMSGYSADAVDALTLGKTLNLILFNKDDMDAAIIDGRGFKDVLKSKMRKAAEEGVVFYPAKAGMVSKDEIAQIEIERSHYDAAAQAVFYQPGHGGSPKDLVIVCEGQADREALAVLTQRILAVENRPKKVEIIAALGKIAVPRVLNSIMGESKYLGRALAVVDGDGDEAGTLEMLRRNIQYEEYAPIIIEPEIESWFGTAKSRKPVRLAERIQELTTLANGLDLEALKAQSQVFSDFYAEVIK